MEEMGCVAVCVALFVVALVVWLTWFVGLWLLAALAAYWITRRMREWHQENPFRDPSREWVVHVVAGLEAVLANIAIGVGLLTVAQFVANLCVWLFTDVQSFDEKLPAWLWNSEHGLATLRGVLVKTLHPRIVLPLIAAALFMSISRPDWQPVKRLFAARKHLARALQVATVVTSASFFTAEYASLHEQSFVQVRRQAVAQEGQLSHVYANQIAAAAWVKHDLETATPVRRQQYAAYVSTLESVSHRDRVREGGGAARASLERLVASRFRDARRLHRVEGGRA